MIKEYSSRFSVGDIITWFCDDDGELHSGTVLYVNKAMTATGTEINYEVRDMLLGEPHTFFVDDCNAMEAEKL